MNYKNLKLLAISIALFSSFSVPVLAHEEGEPAVKEISPNTNSGRKEDTDFSRVFKEGTPDLISPFTWKPDTLSILFSHNFFVNSFPRGSNPAFHFSYAAIKNLQLDAILSLRGWPDPKEFEFGAKYQIFNEFEGAPVSLTPRVSFNTRGNILGLDISATKIFFDDVWQIGVGYRLLNYFGDPKVDDSRYSFVQGVGINTIFRFYKHWHLFGDVVFPFGSSATEINNSLITQHGFVWSAGIKKRIPHSPHILTLYVGNTNESTISGRTISTSTGKYPEALKVGFNFSIAIPNLSKIGEKLF